MLDAFPQKTQRTVNNTFINELVISRVKASHSGWYICVVTNPAGHMIYKLAYLKVLNSYKRHPVTDRIPLHILVGIPIAILLLVAVGYAVWFLNRYQRKSDGLVTTVLASPGAAAKGTLRRPPPPNYPPPSLPAAVGPPSGAVLKTYSHYKHYQHLDPLLASAPLNDSSCRDIYETTPQPYELNYDPRDFSDSYTELSGPHRIQHYPSMYSCN
jgi:hypothetical protein